MEISGRSRLVLKGKRPHSLMIFTNLYNLITAINTAMDTEQDGLVIACVVHVLKTHRLTYLGTSVPRRLVIDQSRVPQRRPDQTATTAHRGKRTSSIPRMLPSRVYTSTKYLPSISSGGTPPKA
jgi:hypothetical protein